MKFVRYGHAGQEKPGVSDKAGHIRDLSGVVTDLAGVTLANLDLLKNLDIEALPKVTEDVRLGPCVGGTGKFICIGLNYSDHAAETGQECRMNRSFS